MASEVASDDPPAVADGRTAAPPPSRNAPCPCGSGRKYKSCCLPLDAARRDRALALSAARKSHAIIDGVLRVVLPLVESRGEHTIACRAGCNDCCTQLIRLSYPEALAVAAWLLEPEQAERLARFEADLSTWRARVGDVARRLDALLARHGDRPRSEPGISEYKALVAEYHSRSAMCPFNDPDGRCGVYPVRPVTCRSYNVADTSAHCRDPNGGSPPVIQHASIDGAIGDIKQILAARSLPGDGHPHYGVLADLVAHALGRLRSDRASR